VKVWSKLHFLTENKYVKFTFSCKSMAQTYKSTHTENELEDIQFTFSQLYSLQTDTLIVWWEINETAACNFDGVGLVKGSYPDESLKYYFHWIYSGDYCLPIEIMVHVTQCSTMNMGLCSHTISQWLGSVWLVLLLVTHTHSHGVESMGNTCTAAYKDYTESTR